MIDFRKVHYVISCPDYTFRPKDNKPEIVFIGRSNVGKSTLINGLVSQKIAYSSKKAGKTKLLNYFLVDDSFYLVDAPGFGYTSYGSKEDDSFSNMMETYFHNPQLKGGLVLADVRRGIGEDEMDMLKYLRKLHIARTLVYTKCDNAKQSEISKAKKEVESQLDLNVFYSYLNGDYKELRSLISKMLDD